MSTLRAWLSLHRSNLLFWSIIAVSFLGTYAANVRWYRLYFPDSRYYLAMTYLFLGNSPEQARDLTIAYSAPHHIAVPELDLLFGWGLVQPRVVLPALSTPFVALLGPAGLAVVPLIAAAALLVITVVLMRRRFGSAPALIVAILANTSIFLLSHQTGMLTESLSALFSALALLAAYRWVKRRSMSLLLAMGAATIASAFTRQATFIMGGAFVMAWLLDMVLNRRKKSEWMLPAIIVAGLALGCQILQTFLFPSFSQAMQFQTQTGASSLGEAVLRAPSLLVSIIKADLVNMLHNDRSLLTLIGLALVGMVLMWRRTEAHLLFGALLATGLYNVTNGTPTGFRYATPGLVFWSLCAAMAVAAAVSRVRTRDMGVRVEGPPPVNAQRRRGRSARS